MTKILWFWSLFFHSWRWIKKPRGRNNNYILGTQNWKQSQADPFLAQRVAIFGRYLYVDNVGEIMHIPHMHIIRMNRIFRIRMANPSPYQFNATLRWVKHRSQISTSATPQNWANGNRSVRRGAKAGDTFPILAALTDCLRFWHPLYSKPVCEQLNICTKIWTTLQTWCFWLLCPPLGASFFCTWTTL